MLEGLPGQVVEVPSFNQILRREISAPADLQIYEVPGPANEQVWAVDNPLQPS